MLLEPVMQLGLGSIKGGKSKKCRVEKEEGEEGERRDKNK